MKITYDFEMLTVGHARDVWAHIMERRAALNGRRSAEYMALNIAESAMCARFGYACSKLKELSDDADLPR